MASLTPAISTAVESTSTVVPSSTTSAPTSASYVPSPSADPNPSQPDPTSAVRTSSRRPGGKPTGTSGGTPEPTSTGDNGPKDQGGGNSSSAPVGAIIGGIAGVLVVGFLIAVFVMRYKKKSKARKRRLDFLGDSTDGASHRPVSTQGAGGLSPSPLPGSRPLEMAAMGGSAAVAASPVVGAAAAQHHANDYQQGYQQVPYGGYPEQYSNDQYDPYYAQRQQQQPPQQQGYYIDPQQHQLQQQGYYQDNQQYQSQFTPPVPISNNLSLGTGSPSMTHATASPPSYPHPPPSTATGDHHSPHTSFQSSVPAPVPGGGSSYDKNAKVESGYAGTQSSARNPQLVPEPQEGIKVPL